MRQGSGGLRDAARRPWAVGGVVLVVLAAVVGVLVVRSDRSPGGPLPFDLPAGSSLEDSPRKVFAHYFPPYPISLDNEDPDRDYYAVHYLDPLGEEGRHAAYGGFLRERPLPRPVSDDPDWALEDMRTEIRRATGAGIDGFTVDLLGLEGSDYWPTVLLLLRAADELDFDIVLMPDATTETVNDPAVLADAVAGLAEEHRSLYRLDDDRLVVSPFSPETVGAGWWSGWLDTMRTGHGLDVALVPCFVTLDAPAADAFAPISHGLSNWGDRSPAFNTDLQRNAADAHDRGLIWMQPVSVQDQRPAQGVFDEANNTENLRVTWQGAIDGADWVQLTTWNDYSEGSEFAPSTHIGWGPLDISAYYLVRFKTGRWPTITDDVLHVSHRVQFADTRPSRQSRLMELRRGSSPTRDDVEVLSFLTAPATVTVTIGQETHEYEAPAGVSAFRAPLQVGEISAGAVREGSDDVSVTSPFPVQETPEIQDEQYYFVSSARPPASSG
ncbi:hypothetical protein E4P40_10010 [Blastococcus sp. CT_GayMR20]|uniref:glycoside hydrolase family 71 protein n=1 Tax=Blastococcus sp. CT_GayMR20 TaxID=2559609 RepID=UPI0010739452|nr:glycoside hydrolase family 71 protein [Blastococcus sp. CT_GayMR20]TFV88392.1 hypothetical protein E4P40_10010 [Blastococcus sp. CT_GayMR20]